MTLALHVAFAFLSGVVIEALYALGVIYIGERRAYLSGALSVVWGASFLLGVNESFHTHIAAGAWCLGLGVGTVLGVWIGAAREKGIAHMTPVPGPDEPPRT